MYMIEEVSNAIEIMLRLNYKQLLCLTISEKLIMVLFEKIYVFLQLLGNVSIVIETYLAFNLCLIFSQA